MKSFPTKELESPGEEYSNSLIAALQDHILTLKKRVAELEEELAIIRVERRSFVPTAQQGPKPRISTMSALTHALEERTRVAASLKAEGKSEE